MHSFFLYHFLQCGKYIDSQTEHHDSYDEMDQLGMFVFDPSDGIDRTHAERHEHGYRQHRQYKNQVIEDQIDISSMRQCFTLGTQIS
jgi:hypothetical protein